MCLEDVVGEEVSAVVRPTRKRRYVRKCLGRCRSRVTPSSLLVPEVLSSPVPSSAAQFCSGGGSGSGQDVAKAVLTRAALASLHEDRIGTEEGAAVQLCFYQTLGAVIVVRAVGLLSYSSAVRCTLEANG